MISAADWVLDSNVLVSGLLSPNGRPGRLLDAILTKRLKIAFDDRILLEYREVLARPMFHFKPADVAVFWEIIPFQRHLVAMPVQGLKASDVADTKFLEVAFATDSKILVSGNMRHYPVESRAGVRVISPIEAFELLQ